MAEHPPDVDIGYKLEVGTTVTFVCAFIVVMLRCLARVIYAKLGWDDYCMLFAVLQALVATIGDFLAVNHGLGRHMIYLTKAEIPSLLFWDYFSQVFCVNALTFAKISICLSYLRILKGSQRPFLRVVCILTAVLVFVINTVVIITFYARCSPTHKSWNPYLPGKCWPSKAETGMVVLQGSFSALTDYFLSIVPIFLLKDLQISRRNKLILCGLMGMGTITGIFATIRTVESGESLTGKSSSDSTYTTILGLMWAGMERNIAMMVASVPSLRPLAEPVVRLTSRTLSSWRSSNRTQRTYEMHSSSTFKGSNSYKENRPMPPPKDLGAIKKATLESDDRSSSLEHILRPAPTTSSMV
ncbi:uncharacterized protein N7459_007020 [Penicillium hispanicum]|uniref:uncharacterized protein n=1 Tax=Penicillium hispanicum TaxID=1080232 RepID=UPI00253FAC60|nr:uncharacterized protein N7459_007020 [Penicillium hispanicum]KAJ5578056.1 hypothetical protein N7459_007020 [Penicillium hispanicum]